MGFTRRQLRELTGWSEHQVRIGLGRLVAMEYVTERREGPGKRHTYAVADEPPAGPREGSRGAFTRSIGRSTWADGPPRADLDK